jgi:hypothetical protein
MLFFRALPLRLPGWHPAGSIRREEVQVNSTGTQPPTGGQEPVWAKLLRWAADAARLVGSGMQAVYYGLKIW